MKEIISTVFQLVGALASLLGLISIFLVIFTILGHRLFAKRWGAGGGNVRIWHFIRS